jgi:hypothetical protein
MDSETLSQKQDRKQKGWGCVGWVVDHLPSFQEALGAIW